MRICIAALLFLLGGCRYEAFPTGGGIYKLDRITGTVSYCYQWTEKGQTVMRCVTEE